MQHTIKATEKLIEFKDGAEDEYKKAEMEFTNCVLEDKITLEEYIFMRNILNNLKEDLVKFDTEQTKIDTAMKIAESEDW
tara:strand:+ start:91 stop:330 length:240 start_codon:yes stop_codon:yes gene_type:complete